MSTVYLVICEDRHLDVQVEVHASKETALSSARCHALGMGWVEQVAPEWLFFAENPHESDQIHVEEAEVQ
jgi:hypothetical protein